MNMMLKDPSMGSSTYDREELDYYPTPRDVTEAVIPILQAKLWRYGYDVSVWEPACGTGEMSDVLADHWPTLSTDIVDRGWQHQHEVKDFFEYDAAPEDDCRAIVTNPPYGNLAARFIEHSIKLMEPKSGIVAMVLRNEYDSAKERFNLFGGNPYFDHKLILTWRPRWIAGSTGSPRHNYAWYVWNTARTAGTPATISYALRGKKD